MVLIQFVFLKIYYDGLKDWFVSIANGVCRVLQWLKLLSRNSTSGPRWQNISSRREQEKHCGTSLATTAHTAASERQPSVV